MKSVKTHLLWVKISLATLFGLVASGSIGFHLDLLQNITLTNKVIFVLLFSIPLVWLAYYFISLFSENLNRAILLFSIAISLAATSLLFIFLYQEIPAVKLHSFELHIPAQNQTKASVRIDDAYIFDTIDQDIPLNHFHRSGDIDNFEDKTLTLHTGATISLAKLYAGELRLVFSSPTCPLMVDLIIDSTSKTVDLCDFRSPDGFSMNVESAGTISMKWLLLLQFFKYADVLLCFLFFMGLFYFLIQLIGSRNRTVPSLEKHFNSKKQLHFFISALLIVSISTFIIIWKKISALDLFIPCILFMAFFFIYPYLKYQSRVIPFAFVIIILLSCVVINYRLQSSNYFNPLYAPLEPVKDTQENSFNALVLSVFKGFSYSLHYGFRDILDGRELIVTQDTSSILDLDISALSDVLSYADVRIENSEKYAISEEDFSCILKSPHTDWTSGHQIQIIGLDKTYFTNDEPAILDQYNKTILLLPSSFFTSEGICR